MGFAGNCGRVRVRVLGLLSVGHAAVTALGKTPRPRPHRDDRQRRITLWYDSGEFKVRVGGSWPRNQHKTLWAKSAAMGFVRRRGGARGHVGLRLGLVIVGHAGNVACSQHCVSELLSRDTSVRPRRAADELRVRVGCREGSWVGVYINTQSREGGTCAIDDGHEVLFPCTLAIARIASTGPAT